MEFLQLECQDQLLLSWMLSSMSDDMLLRIVGCEKFLPSMEKDWESSLHHQPVLQESSSRLNYGRKKYPKRKNWGGRSQTKIRVHQNHDARSVASLGTWLWTVTICLIDNILVHFSWHKDQTLSTNNFLSDMVATTESVLDSD